jgi:hypothetical protein
MDWGTMGWIGPPLLAGLIAGILTYVDLDTVFDAPPQALTWGPWLRLRAWWWGFVLVNAVLAGVLFYLLEKTYFKDLNAWLGALVAGSGYTALVRLQFTTLPMNGKSTPIGIETFYEGLKSLVHKRINRIIRQWRMEESATLAKTDVAALRQRALLMVGSDALLSVEQKNATTAWLEQIAKDDKTPDADRRRILAIFIITEQKPS